MNPYDIYISYRRISYDTAIHVPALLRTAGYSVFFLIRAFVAFWRVMRFYICLLGGIILMFMSSSCSDSVSTPEMFFDKDSLQLSVGEEYQLLIKDLPKEYSNDDLIWSSSNERVAKVYNGKILAIGIGISTIVAEISNLGIVTKCVVSVIEPAKIDDYIDEYGINHGPGIMISGIVWAPVNCGYHKDKFIYGKYYQWGRKYGQGTAGNLSPNIDESDLCHRSDDILPMIRVCNENLVAAQGIDNANIFFSLANQTGTVSDWTTQRYNHMWNSAGESSPLKTEYDPCPYGWRIPSSYELQRLTLIKSSFTRFNGVGGVVYIDMDQEDSVGLFLPAGGASRGEKSNNRGVVGNYWASDVQSGKATMLYFSIQDYDKSEFLYNGNFTYGRTIRCVRDSVDLVPVEEVRINTSKLTLNGGDVYKLSASVTPSDATHQSIVWYSECPEIVSVDRTGMLTSKNGGYTNIYAMAGMKTAKCEVAVMRSVEGVSLNRKTVRMTVGGELILTANIIPNNATNTNISWDSSDITVASVNDGKVIAHNAGHVKVTVTTEDGCKSEWCDITVVPASDDDYFDEYGINHGAGVQYGDITWAPVNCGYKAPFKGDQGFPFGKLYQWGRKYGQFTHIEGDCIVEPEIMSGPIPLYIGIQEEYADMHFTNADASSEDYCSWLDHHITNLWNLGTETAPIKSEYDPCPEGWRIPTNKEMATLKTFTWQDNYIGQKGALFSDAQSQFYEDDLFFPAAGYRIGGNDYCMTDYIGIIGNYWSSSHACQISFYEELLGRGSSWCIYGYSIRCVQDKMDLVYVKELSLSETSIVMNEGESITLEVLISPSNSTHRLPIWYVEDDTIVSVSSDGQVKAIMPGVTNVIVVVGMKYAICQITVEGVD